MGRSARSGFALLALLVFAQGCALLPGSGRGPVRDGPLVRPEAPADYDALVGEMAARDGNLIEARDAFVRAAEKDPDSALLQRRIAVLSTRLEDAELARTAAARAVELDPSDGPMRLLLARLLRQAGDNAGVEAALQDESGAPFSLHGGVLLVPLMLESGRRAEAQSTAEGLIAKYPDEILGYFSLASVHEDRGDRAQVEAVMLRAITAFPDEPELYARLAQLRRAAGDADGEVVAYRMLLERQPDHLGTLRVFGALLNQRGDSEGAREIFKRASDLYPNESALVKQLVAMDAEAGDYAAAQVRLEAIVERNPDDNDLIYMLGIVLLEQDLEEAAIEQLGRIPASSEIYAEARLRLAGLHEEAGRFEQALFIFEELRALQPNKQLDLHTAGIRAKSGDLAGGVGLVQEYVDADPTDAGVLYQMGLVYELVQQRNEAIAWMRRALEHDPRNAHALNYIGYAFAERGERLEEAENLIKRALEVEPEDGFITDSLGWVYYMRARPLVEDGRNADAKQWLDLALATLTRAARLAGGDPVISEHLGDVHLLAGDKRQALDFYEEAVELKPRDDEQPELRSKLETLRAEFDRP